MSRAKIFTWIYLYFILREINSDLKVILRQNCLPQKVHTCYQILKLLPV